MSNSIVLDLNSVYDHTTHSESLKDFSYSTKKENRVRPLVDERRCDQGYTGNPY